MLISCLPVQSEIVCYSKEQIAAIWPDVMEYVLRGIGDRNAHTLPRVYKGLESGEYQLWTAQMNGIQAVMITSIQTDNECNAEGERVKFCLILSAGGVNMDSWLDTFVSYMEDWAKEQGCTELRIYGRRGWARKLGYTIEYTKMVKKLMDL